MKKGLFIIILTLIVKSSFGQQFTDLYGDYLGQVVPGDTPVVFAQGIISKSSLEHSAAIFSPDGNEVYWCSIELPLDKNKKKLWYMKRINNRWTEPQVAPFSVEGYDNDNPFYWSEKKRFCYTSKAFNNCSIWYVEKSDTGFTKPQSMTCYFNGEKMSPMSPSITTTGRLYFVLWDSEGNTTIPNIYRTQLKEGKFSKFELLPNSINSEYFDWTPFIAPDESYLIFSSNRDNSNDAGDLYISFHDKNKDTWTKPINMGEPINTWAQERFPAVSPDGKYLFFTRWTENNHQDIFWVSAKIIDRLKEKSKGKK
jgi:hypothetical protein